MRYTGWGALPGVFDPRSSREWQATAQQLRNLLSPEEYASARASTPNAHFTSPEVVRAIWQAMEQFGLESGAYILEPSVGVGHFFGMMPESLLQRTRGTGVELDSLTARIATKLYPDSNIQAKGFEETGLPKNFFDAAVGNIPFGNYPVFDPAYRRTPQLTRSIHDYFLAKTLDTVKPDGVIALVTSRYTMDKQDCTVREHLAAGAGLLGAIRLPNTAFKANAGTDVTTDILFLQKRSATQSIAKEEKWTDLSAVNTPDGKIQINEYFARHPEMMLGQMRVERGVYGETPVLAGELKPDALTGAISRLPSRVLGKNIQPTRDSVAEAEHVPAIGELKEGGFAERNGRIFVREGERLEPLALPASAQARIWGMIEIRESVREVFRTQLSETPDQTIAEARRDLNRTEQKLKQLLTRQAELNASLDLDKGDQQAMEETPELEQKERSATSIEKQAEQFMRESGTAIRELPIRQTAMHKSGQLSGKAVAQDASQIALATSSNRFVVFEALTLGGAVEVGERISLVITNGRPAIAKEQGISR